MPRNTQGGSGHKAQRNTETSKARNNREFIDALLDDYTDKANTDGVHVGRVTKRMGSGRMEVFYHMTREDGSKLEVTQIVPMRGGLRGKGKKSVWVDTGALVMIVETGLGNTTHEIVAVFSQLQVARYRRLLPDADPRLFLKGPGDPTDEDGGGISFDAEDDDAEVNVDAI